MSRSGERGGFDIELEKGEKGTCLVILAVETTTTVLLRLFKRGCGKKPAAFPKGTRPQGVLQTENTTNLKFVVPITLNQK